MMHCPSCGRNGVFEDTTMWCENCKEWVDIEDYHKTLEQEIVLLREQLAEDQEELRKLREHLGTRIAIEEARPPLSVGKPCYKCGQIYTGG